MSSVSEPTTLISLPLLFLASFNSHSANTPPSPRIWFFHCHIEWHLASGLIATMIEAPPLLQSSLSIPADHYEVCKAQNIPIVGNAAGNDKDFLDLTGVPEPPGPLPDGFTPKGIVALVFSILTAFLGIATISWYVASLCLCFFGVCFVVVVADTTLSATTGTAPAKSASRNPARASKRPSLRGVSATTRPRKFE